MSLRCIRQNGRAAVVLPDGFLFGTDNTKTAIKKKLLEEFNLHTSTLWT
ncbi:MAG: N-6 DNA methylase [Selenomonas sp.]|nr:N-6 DNA methylase [Selenomonas sp.]